MVDTVRFSGVIAVATLGQISFSHDKFRPIPFYFCKNKPWWLIHVHKPSVLCTPPFEKSLIRTHRFCVLPPLKTSLIRTHRFCVLPPLKTSLIRTHRFCVLPPLKTSLIRTHRFCVLPPLKTSLIRTHRFCVLPPLKTSLIKNITYKNPSVLCTPPFEKWLFLVDVYFGVGAYFGK